MRKCSGERNWERMRKDEKLLGVGEFFRRERERERERERKRERELLLLCSSF